MHQVHALPYSLYKLWGVDFRLVRLDSRDVDCTLTSKRSLGSFLAADWACPWTAFATAAENLREATVPPAAPMALPCPKTASLQAAWTTLAILLALFARMAET